MSTGQLLMAIWKQNSSINFSYLTKQPSCPKSQRAKLRQRQALGIQMAQSISARGTRVWEHTWLSSLPRHCTQKSFAELVTITEQKRLMTKEKMGE